MTVIIILAAGASIRLGKAKQTLRYKDKSLLNYTLDVAIDAGIGPVLVVIGANETDIRSHIEEEGVTIVVNNDWRNGMASSIHSAISYVEKNMKQVEDVILMVCDQPHVNKKILQSLLETRRSSNKSIIACAYKNTVGVPALFDKIHFEELLTLNGDEGGKKVLLKHQKALAVIPFPDGEVDIDTPADYEALIEKETE